MIFPLLALAFAQAFGWSGFLENSVIRLPDALLPRSAFRILLPHIFEDDIDFSFGHKNIAAGVLSTLPRAQFRVSPEPVFIDATIYKDVLCRMQR